MALSPEIVASQPAISQLDNPSDHINSSAPPAHQEEGEAAAHSPSAQAALPKAQAGASKLQRKRNANITNSLDESCKRFPPDTGKARGIRARIRRFSPAWFSVTMGSGIPSVLLFLTPWEASHKILRGFGCAFLIFDMGLFSFFVLLFATRYCIWPSIFSATLRHEVHSLFLGTLPMGYITCVTAIGLYGDSFNLPGSVMTASVLYWIALALSLFSILIVPWMMVTTHTHRAEGLTAAWLLPYVPPLTVASSGSALSNLLIDSHPNYALDILLTSYVCLGVGLFTACTILVLYFQRLTLHKLPPKEVIVSTLLPLGPTGQSGYAVIQLGRVSTRLFPKLAEQRPSSQAWQDLASVGPALYGAGILLGLLLFAFGAWWSWIAVNAVGSHLYRSFKKPDKHRTKFSLGWWATTFPVGSMNLVTYALGNAFDNMFFKVLGTILTGIVIVCWVIVTIPTVNGFRRGTLFEAPCLADVVKREQQHKEESASEKVNPMTESV